MITEAEHNGGAAYSAAASVTLYMNSPRSLNYAATSGTGIIMLPAAHEHQVDPAAAGGPKFIIFNTGSLTPEIRRPLPDGGYAVVGTVAATTGTAVVELVDAATNLWVTVTRTRNASMSFSRDAYTIAPNDAADTVYDPFCFVGTDCEYADTVPLDGTGGRDLVIAPMFQDIGKVAQNDAREPIRASDVVMPDKIVLRIRPGEFVKDPLHPLSGVTLSQGFWDAFENGGDPHLLPYLGTNASQYSRNPYHTRGVGATFAAFAWDQPAFPGVPVVRSIWEKVAAYSGGTMRLRFQMEHTVGIGVTLPVTFVLNGAGATPSTSSTATGSARFDIDLSTGAYTVTGTFTGLNYEATGAALFRDGPFMTAAIFVALVSATNGTSGTLIGSGVLTQDEMAQLLRAQLHLHVKTSVASHGGEIGGVVVPNYTTPGLLYGQTSTTSGLRGALFMFYAFVDELMPSWVEGGAFQANGFSATNVFTREDPFIWGGTASGGTADDKGCHPHLVACGALKTTWHDPCLYEWVPLLDRRYVMNLNGGNRRGYNRQGYYKRPNCSPWVPNPTRDEVYCRPCDHASGVLGITHFGSVIGSYNLAAQTRGGDTGEDDRSIIPAELCMENGLATGRTYLVPERPGWDEEIGRMTENGSSAVITICGPEDEGDDGDGWPTFKVNNCMGHPSEPLDGIGGTHRCFRTATLSAETCCISLVDDGATVLYSSQHTPHQDPDATRPPTRIAVADATDYCTRAWVLYGEANGSSCSAVKAGCSVAAWYRTQRILNLFNYDFYYGGNVDLREAVWRRYMPSPAEVLHSYTYSSTDVANLNNEVGTATFNVADITVTAVNAAKTLTAVTLFEPPSYTYRDMLVQATAKQATSKSHGLAVRMEVDGSDNSTGYYAMVTPTGSGAGTAALWRIVAGTPTLMQSTAIVLDDDTVTMTLEASGDEIVFTWSVNGGPTGTISKIDCSRESGGYAGLVSGSATAGAVFESLVVTDYSYLYEYIEAYQGKMSIGLDFPTTLRYSYGQCGSTYNPTCGNCCAPEICNCYTYDESLITTGSASWSGPGDLLGSPAPTSPTYLGGPSARDCDSTWCSGTDAPCGVCPPPYIALNLSIPYRCRPKELGDEPRLCAGMSRWYETGVYCE